MASPGWQIGEDSRSISPAGVQPGEYWLIEQPAAKGLCALDRSAVSGADIVIYDRPLAALVAQVLPIGRYAEPLLDRGEASPVSPRGLQFATEGWRVVQLVEAPSGGSRRLREVVTALLRCHADHPPVRVIAKRPLDERWLGDDCPQHLAELSNLCDADAALTVIFGPLAVRYPAQPYAFAALAG